MPIIAWHWHRKRYIVQQKDTEHRNKPIYLRVIVKKDVWNLLERKDNLFNKSYWKADA